MAESPCLCGFTTVRKGSRLIGRLQFWFGMIGALIMIVLLILLIALVAGGHLEEFKKQFEDQHPVKTNIVEVFHIIILLCVYCLASVLVMIYTGHILIKATLNHNLQYVETWLKINGIFVIISLVYSVIDMIIKQTFEPIIRVLLGFCFSIYLWTTVYQFYKDEKPSAL